MKFTDNEVFNYMKQWQSDQYTDLDIFLDTGYDDLAAILLVEAGAIDSNMCDTTHSEIEACIEGRVKKLKARKTHNKLHGKQIDECLKDVQTFVCRECDAHQFIDPIIDDASLTNLNKWACPSCARKGAIVTSEEYYKS